MSTLDLLQWRYATKKMSGEKIPAEKLERILEAVRLAPTSSGLQPFEVVVVSNQDMKTKLQAASFNQSVVSECSHLLVFAAWTTYTAERINHMFDLTNEVRGYKNEGFEAYRQMLLNTYPQREAEANYQHAARQAYIAFTCAMVQAAEEKVDCTPMEGFDPAKVDEILGLAQHGLRSCVLLPLGYRAKEGDWLNGQKKVRRPKENIIREIK